MKAIFLAGGITSIALFFYGCVSAQTLYHADPVSTNTVWYSGEEFQIKTKDSITVSVAFENGLNSTMTFYAVVGNMGLDTVLVAPEKFYFYGAYEKVKSSRDYLSDYTSYDTLRGVDTTFAIDPESQIAGINNQIVQTNATYSTNNNLNATSALLNLVGAVATIGQNKTAAQRREERHQQHSVAESQEENQANYQSSMDQLNSERDYWQNATLRKTTLFPGTAIGGKVCFPVEPDVRTFKLIVPIDTTSVEFDFTQKPVKNQ